MDIVDRLYDYINDTNDCELRMEAAIEITRLRCAIAETLDENGYLADGENCTLIKLKMVMPNDAGKGLATTGSDKGEIA